MVTEVFSVVLAYERRTTVHSRVDLPWVKSCYPPKDALPLTTPLHETPILEMTRGALVLWVGIFSVIFLRRRLFLYQYVAFLVGPLRLTRPDM